MKNRRMAKAKEMAYKWANRRYSGDVEKFVQECEAARNEDGVLRSERIVDRARPEGSVLHEGYGFVWDDAKAAELQRKAHASTLIRAVVKVETKQEPEHKEYVLVERKQKEEKRTNDYVQMSYAVTRKELYESALGKLQKEVAHAQKSMQQLIEMSNAEHVDTDAAEYIKLAYKALDNAYEAIRAAMFAA